MLAKPVNSEGSVGVRRFGASVPLQAGRPAPHAHGMSMPIVPSHQSPHGFTVSLEGKPFSMINFILHGCDRPHPDVGRRARRQASETTASMEPSSMMHASGTARAAAVADVAIDAAVTGGASAEGQASSDPKRTDARGRGPLGFALQPGQVWTTLAFCYMLDNPASAVPKHVARKPSPAST